MRFGRVFTLTVDRFSKLMRETCQVFFWFFCSISAPLPNQARDPYDLDSIPRHLSPLAGTPPRRLASARSAATYFGGQQ